MLRRALLSGRALPGGFQTKAHVSQGTAPTLTLRRTIAASSSLLKGARKVEGTGDHGKDRQQQASFQQVAGAAEVRMQQAIKDGALDNLPGSGKKRKEDVTKGHVASLAGDQSGEAQASYQMNSLLSNNNIGMPSTEAKKEAQRLWWELRDDVFRTCESCSAIAWTGVGLRAPPVPENPLLRRPRLTQLLSSTSLCVSPLQTIGFGKTRWGARVEADPRESRCQRTRFARSSRAPSTPSPFG